MKEVFIPDYPCMYDYKKKCVGCFALSGNIENLRIRKYSHKFSKKMYGNWVHIVLLALRQKMDKSYREFTDVLDVCTELLNLLEIKIKLGK